VRITIQGNPANSCLGIVCDSGSELDYELELFDISGRKVLDDSGILTSTDSRIDIGVSNIPSGVYLLRIRTGDIEIVKTVSIIH
ncbi:MAG: T9SS type A sorting domain-containing protein, partial [Candidatus Aegiribacteria sp.]|nr:T9SS type A sorting domain-containing protein [Candidatus Aegiribacteria sp.]